MQEFNEVSPPGWSGSVAAMLQKHPELPRTKKKNPWALAWYMKKKKGAKPHYKEQPGKHSLSPKKAEKKAKYKHEDKPKRKKFSDWLVDRDKNVLFEDRTEQMRGIKSALMSLRYLAPQGLSNLSVTKIGDLLDKEGKVPDDISSLRFAAMIKSMARGASKEEERPYEEAKKLAKDILDDMPPKKSKKKK